MAWRHRSARCALPDPVLTPAARASAAPAALLPLCGTVFRGARIMGVTDGSLTADGVQPPLFRGPPLPDPLILVLIGFAGMGAGMRLLGTEGGAPDGR